MTILTTQEIFALKPILASTDFSLAMCPAWEEAEAGGYTLLCRENRKRRELVEIMRSERKLPLLPAHPLFKPHLPKQFYRSQTWRLGIARVDCLWSQICWYLSGIKVLPTLGARFCFQPVLKEEVVQAYPPPSENLVLWCQFVQIMGFKTFPIQPILLFSFPHSHQSLRNFFP
jgi:hypothetical protein